MRLLVLMWLVVMVVCEGDYKYLNYTQINQKISELAKEYPDLIKAESIHQKYNLPHQGGDCGHSKCVITYVSISDYKIPPGNKVQVYLSGNLHGDEQLGPNVLVYLAEYLAKTYNDGDISHFNNLREREIIMTPMTNAQGYYWNHRHEETDKGQRIDVNRDFPYNRDDDN
mmetsp:Transcript_38594/g.38119  ORF Transcript_38594/g.38119 Transcript_38594/m.38119 type:complete len:170 (+) Transcript_38594:3-512(+)